VYRRFAVLDAPDVKRCRSAKIDLRPFQIADFGGPQAMPEGNQDQSGVAVTIATLPRLLHELLDLAGIRYSRARSSAFAGRTGTDRFSRRGVTNHSCAFIGFLPLARYSPTG
jgi:hypothetical protein